MNTFEIVVSLNNTNNKASVLTVMPHDNHENSYPTYFQLFEDSKLFAEIRLNDELQWEICKGAELPPQDIQLLMKEIEINVYKHPSEENSACVQVEQAEKPHSASWLDKILTSLGSKKSAA